MLDETAIRRRARELGVRTDYAEKDYVNSWVLYCASIGPVSGRSLRQLDDLALAPVEDLPDLVERLLTFLEKSFALLS